MEAVRLAPDPKRPHFKVWCSTKPCRAARTYGAFQLGLRVAFSVPHNVLIAILSALHLGLDFAALLVLLYNPPSGWAGGVAMGIRIMYPKSGEGCCAFLGWIMIKIAFTCPTELSEKYNMGRNLEPGVNSKTKTTYWTQTVFRFGGWIIPMPRTTNCMPGPGHCIITDLRSRFDRRYGPGHTPEEIPTVISQGQRK